MAHIVIERLDHWRGETVGTIMPNGSSTAARQRRQQAQERLYLFHLGFFGQTVMQGHVQLQELHHDQRAQ
jgi:hypothetical protein